LSKPWNQAKLILTIFRGILPFMENDLSLKTPKNEIPSTFEGFIGKYDTAYKQAFETYVLEEDEDLLGQCCDRLRGDILPKALKLAQTKEQCQQILNLTMPRNTELRTQIQAKIEVLKA
jgi:hypothetical protein